MADYIGTNAGETIVGGAADDRIVGRGGNDTLTGGGGNDVFAYDTRRFGIDTITDFNTNGDRIDLSYLHVADFASLRHVLYQDGNDVLINLGYDISSFNSNVEVIRIKNIALSSLSDADFVFSTSTNALTVKGTYHNDTLFGGAGNDTISGGDYYDEELDFDDHDRLIGGAGNDRIIGGIGSDVLVGGTGNDIFVYDHRGFDDDWIVDFDTNGDRIDLSYLHVADLASLRHFVTQDGADVVIALEYGARHEESIRLKNVALSSLGDADFVFNTSTAGLNVTAHPYGGVLFGGNGNDLITGSEYWDSLVGGGGNDRLIGGASDDWLMGGAGNDIFVYSERRFGHDTIADFDTNGDRIDLSYLNVADIGSLRPFMAQDGNDVVIDLGSLGFEESIRIENVALASLSNADFVFNTSTTGLTVSGPCGGVVFGGAGNDRIVGGTGRLVGGTGNDTFVYRTNHVRDTIFDFNTNGDRIDLSAVHIPDLGSLLPFMAQDGDDVVITFGNGESIRLLNVYLGSLSTADFIFDTSTGADTIYGTVSDDVLFGGAGNDVLFGNPVVWTPGDGADRLFGGAGDDVLDGGTWTDRLDGGAGIDTASYYYDTAGVSIDLGAHTASGGKAQGDVLTSIENLTGGQANDTLAGDAGANILRGWNGDDVLRGGAGADRLDGGAGTDTVSYYTGSVGVAVDLAAGTGSGGEAQGDTFVSIEKVSGSQGSDRLTGNASANLLHGWDGDDVLSGGGGADRLIGGIGIDIASYYGSTSAVAVNLQTGNGGGGAQGDTFEGIENVDGGKAGDILTGNTGANELNGYEGNDVLRGSAGKDTLTGGTGGDRFVFTATGDSVVGASADRITDFNRAQGDKIDLSTIDANSAVSGNEAFTFIGSGLYTHHAGELRFAVNGSVTTIAGDVNGDGISDFHIVLVGTVSPQGSDFIL